MGVPSDAAVPSGNLVRQLDDVKSDVAQSRTARRGQATSVGAGGTRYHSGGGFTVEGGGSGNIRDGGSMTVEGGGDIGVNGGRLYAEDPEGELIFEVDSDPASIFMKQDLVQGLVETIIASPSGRELAAAIFTDRIGFDYDEDVAERNLTTYGDPTNGADPGPSVTIDVLTGTAIVLQTADILFATDVDSGDYYKSGFLSYAVSGATTIAPDANSNKRALGAFAQIYGSTAGGVGVQIQYTATKISIETGLGVGENTFTSKYQMFSGADSAFHCSGRGLVVIAF